MKNKIFMLCMFVVLMVTVTNCDSGVSPEEKGERMLFDTRWKLAGFYDVERNELREPRYGEIPFDLEHDRWYTLHFLSATDDHMGAHQANGISVGNMAGCAYIADYALSTFVFFHVTTLVTNDFYDGQDYIDALQDVQAFELKDTSLKLYYNDKKNYLLFRPWEKQ
jgi:hypothetical protein